MKLKHIEAGVCPVCGARAVKEEQTSVHSNGLTNEYRAFACGCVLHFSPNFNKVETDNNCPNTSEQVEIRDKRKAASLKLVKYIRKLDVDEDFIDMILRDVRFNLCCPIY